MIHNAFAHLSDVGTPKRHSRPYSKRLEYRSNRSGNNAASPGPLPPNVRKDPFTTAARDEEPSAPLGEQAPPRPGVVKDSFLTQLT